MTGLEAASPVFPCYAKFSLNRKFVSRIYRTPSVVRLDLTFDDLGLLGDQFRQVFAYVVRSQADGLVGSGLVLKDADRGPFALAGVKPVVPHESFCLFDERHEALAHLAVNLCAILRIEMVVANNCNHEGLLLEGEN